MMKVQCFYWLNGNRLSAIMPRSRESGAIKSCCILSCTKSLFTWKEEDPSVRKILEGGFSLRHMFSLLSLHE